MYHSMINDPPEEVPEVEYPPIKRGHRSYFWKILLLIGCFYAIPAIQFVVWQAQDPTITCYYNFKCEKPWGVIPAFNNIVSNIGYIILSLAFMFWIWINTPESDDMMGTDKNPSLYYALSWGLFLEGVFSAIYHVCPSKLNFQFDTTFMFIGVSLITITLYLKRHMNHKVRPFGSYAGLAFVIFLNIMPLTHDVSPGLRAWFYIVIYSVLIYVMLVGSIHFYHDDYMSLRLSWNRIFSMYDSIRNCEPIKDIPSFLALAVSNITTFTMAIYGTIAEPQFTTWLLGVFIANAIIYLSYYIVMKYKNEERLTFKLWTLFVAAVTILGISIYFFNIVVTNKLLPINESNSYNKPCVLFGYFDYHDVWHFLSSIGLFLIMLFIYHLDEDLDGTPRSEIGVF